MVVNHPVHMQVFHTDKTELIDNVATVLMGEVGASPRDPFMDASDSLAMFASLRRALCPFGVLALDFCQGFLLLAEETGILDFLSIRKGGKGFQSDINANLRRMVWQSLWLVLSGEAGIPLARRGSPDGAGLDHPLDRAMIGHLDTADFGEANPFIMRDAKATLGIGDAIVALFAFKTGVSWLFPSFDAAKESFHRQINPNSDVLQDLGMNHREGGPFLFQYRIGLLLLKTRRPLTRLLIGGFALFEQMIIEPATLFKHHIKGLALFFGRINPVLKGFKHGLILCLNCRVVKGLCCVAPPYPP
jgi:hypothetical protein